MSGIELASQLTLLNVPVVRHEHASTATQFCSPVALLAELAASNEARLRMAIIPLLLQHPEYASAAPLALPTLTSQQQIVLRCYYTAAHLLQKKYAARLCSLLGPRSTLPDLFSADLGIPSADTPEVQLQQLAARQAKLTGDTINWAGTYEHAMNCLLTQVEHL